MQKALKETSDPEEVVRLSLLWSSAYERQLLWLVKHDRVQKGEHDYDKIVDAIHPANLAASRAQEVVLRRYFKQVARIICSAAAEGVLVFFDASSIATDYDELELMNQELQRQFIRKLEPYLAHDWKAALREELQRAEPRLRQD